MWLAALTSGLVHVVYSLVLQRGYRVGDFAVVYPVARGTGPLLAVLGALTGLGIAGYTVIDGWAVKLLGMAPLLFYAVGLLFRTLVLAPWALRKGCALRDQWRQHRTAIILVGMLSPLAYLLVLFAVQAAPLSYVAPVREISMLMGTRLLNESLRPSQVFGAAMMLLGVAGLALA